MDFCLPHIHGLTQSLAIFGLPGGMEWIVILIIGLLIFGRRLPDVGRSLGRSIVEFKRGVKGIREEIDDESTKETAQQSETAKITDESVSRKTDSVSESSKVDADASTP